MARCHTQLATKLIAAAAGLMLLPAVALAGLAEGDYVGSTEADITAQLTQQGYEVKEVELEDGEIEAEVVLNGETFEIEVDPKTGKVTEIEQDD